MSVRLVSSIGLAGAKGARSAGSRSARVTSRRCASAKARENEAAPAVAASTAPNAAAELSKNAQDWTSPGSDYSKFEAASTFKSLDANNDGVLSRDEVIAGAWRFNMQPAEASALFDRLDTNKDGVLTPTEWAANAWDSSVGKHMSFSSAESDFAAVRPNDLSLFQSLDANNDGVLSREEVVSGAWRFNLKPEQASALFDRLDANGDGVLSQREWDAHAWEESVSMHMSFTGDYIVPPFQALDANEDGVLSRDEVVAGAHRFNMTGEMASALFDRLDTNKDGVLSQTEWQVHVNEELVGKYMSFASAESDFVAPRAAELEALEDAPPPTNDWLLFPTSINFAGADNDWCAPTAAEIKAADPYLNPTSVSWSSPFSDWVGPSKAEVEAPQHETSLSFASPESDWIATRPEEIAASIAHSAETSDHAHLSYAAAESDFTSPYANELARAEAARQEFDSSSLSYAHLSFATPTADFLGTHAYPKEAGHDSITLSEAMAPTNEARVLTSADGRFRIQHVNDAWTRLCGYTNEQSAGKTLGILQGEATDTKAVEELVAMLRQGKSTEAVLINYDRYGRKFRNHLKTIPVVSDETGEITHFLGTLRDIGGADNSQLASAQAVMVP